MAPLISRNSVYFLNPSLIEAKLTLLFYVHASMHIYFSANVHRYLSNNSYDDARFDNSSQ